MPLSNSTRMGEALDGADVANKVVVIEGARHGFRGEHGQRARSETLAFLTAHLVPADE